MIALAGNKADLTNSRVVEFEEAKQYAEENGLLFMETSAKTAMNVNDIFLAIGKHNIWSLNLHSSYIFNDSTCESITMLCSVRYTNKFMICLHYS